MIRASRLILGAVLVIAAGCAESTPTAPERSASTMAPDIGPSFVEGDTTCRGGWSVPNGKSC
jgi:hypothetical protein